MRISFIWPDMNNKQLLDEKTLNKANKIYSFIFYYA